MKRHSPHSNHTQSLIALAQDVAAQADTDTLSAAEARLADRVTRLVRNGSDRAILEALESLYGQHAHDAADVLYFWAEDAADTVDVVLDPPDQPESGEASTFLIPLILISSPDQPIPVTIDTEACKQLTQSFRAHPIIPADPSLALLPHLFRLADLPSTWSRRRQWLDAIIAIFHGKPLSSKVVSTPEEPVETADNTAALMLHLRFLVGAVVSNGTYAAQPLWKTFDLDAETPLVPWSAWEESIQDLLCDALGVTEVIAGDPGLWSHTLEAGLSLWNQTVLNISLEAFCQQSQVTPNTVTADIRWNETQAAWQIAFARLDHVGESLFWIGSEDPDQQRDDLLETLRAAGIRKISIDEHGRDHDA